ncbi:hypothetical protein DIPPA_08360 [Diplonema papillatum]|nr:hypothetical protein DIPPA_08360 [Diplonema papillatum]
MPDSPFTPGMTPMQYGASGNDRDLVNPVSLELLSMEQDTTDFNVSSGSICREGLGVSVPSPEYSTTPVLRPHAQGMVPIPGLSSASPLDTPAASAAQKASLHPNASTPSPAFGGSLILDSPILHMRTSCQTPDETMKDES